MEEQEGNRRSIHEKIGSVDRMLRKLEVRTGDIVEQGQARKETGGSSNFNSRGDVILSGKEVRENYDKAFYFFKWYQLPFCRKTIKHKLNFWAPASVVLAWTYGQYYKKRSPATIIEKLPFKFYLKAYAVIFSATALYSFAQSLLFDQFCDIDSPFYQENETRLSMAKRIRSQIAEKDGGFLREMF